jgi:hypothetical membrane protein
VQWAAWIWLVSGVLYLVCEGIAAVAFPDYSYARNYISDLGVPDIGPFKGTMIDSPLHAVMNFGFIERGVLFAIASLLITRGTSSRQRTIFLTLVFCHGIGGVLVGLVPASPAAAAAGIHFLHVIGALFAITAGNALLIYVGLYSAQPGASRTYKIACTTAGVLGFIGFILLLTNIGLQRPVLFEDGVWERLSVYPIIAWTTVTGILILAHARKVSFK